MVPVRDRADLVKTARVDEVLGHVHGRVLDIGCSGQENRRSPFESRFWLHGRLLEKCPDAWGLEFDAANIAALADAGVGNVQAGDAQDFDLDQRFQTIIAGELIEHLGNPAGLLDSSRRHLTSDGRLIITTPYAFNVFFMMYAWLKFPKTCSNDEHTVWFCPTTLTQLAERQGFAVEKLTLVADYRTDVPSRMGRLLAYFARSVGMLLPIRVRANTMVAVLAPRGLGR